MIEIKRAREGEYPPKETIFSLRGRIIDPRDILRFEKRAIKKGLISADGTLSGHGQFSRQLLSAGLLGASTSHVHNIAHNIANPLSLNQNLSRISDTKRRHQLAHPSHKHWAVHVYLSNSTKSKMHPSLAMYYGQIYLYVHINHEVMTDGNLWGDEFKGIITSAIWSEKSASLQFHEFDLRLHTSVSNSVNSSWSSRARHESADTDT